MSVLRAAGESAGWPRGPRDARKVAKGKVDASAKAAVFVVAGDGQALKVREGGSG